MLSYDDGMKSARGPEKGDVPKMLLPEPPAMPFVGIALGTARGGVPLRSSVVAKARRVG